MIQGLASLVRVADRELGGVRRSAKMNQGGESNSVELDLADKHSINDEDQALVNEEDVFSAVINFQLVPSGRVHMNREVREHIIDFFR